jgi:flagellar motor switch protein FliM
MPEILTQKDIDALFKGGAATAPPTVADVVPYNFAHPPRMSKDRRAGLEQLCARYALSLQALLSTRLRAPVDITIPSLEQTPFTEFVLALESPCAVFVFKTGDRFGGHGVFDFGPETAYYLVDRLFGGPGESHRMDRPLTSLEQIVLRNIAERALALLREVWQEELPLAPEVVSFEANPDTLAAAVNGDDNVVVIHLEIHSDSFRGTSMIALPLTTLDPYLQVATARTAPARSARSDHSGSRPYVETAIQHARLQVAVRFPRVRLTTREVAALAPGQTLHLAHTADEPVEVHINGRVRYLGTLGQIRRRVALRITEAVTAPVSERPGLGRQGRVS